MKSLILTGASGGIGSQIAKSAQKSDYKVGLIDIDEEKICLLYTSPSPRD